MLFPARAPVVSFVLEAPLMKAMREVQGVELYCGDQCCFRQAAKGPDGVKGLARKRSGWLTKSPCVGYALQVRCPVNDRGDKPFHIWSTMNMYGW